MSKLIARSKRWSARRSGTAPSSRSRTVWVRAKTAFFFAVVPITKFESCGFCADTIIDYDKILVLDHGNIAEYDSPARLLEKKDGVFSALIDKTGA